MAALKHDDSETVDQQQQQHNNNENQEDPNNVIQHPVKKKLQDHINQLSRKMKYKNKIDEIISGLQLFSSIEQMFRIIDKELVGCFFTQIINCMLDMRWTKQKERKTNLIIESIKNSLKYLNETDNFFHIFQYLLQTRIWSEADEFVEILLRNASDNTDVLTDEDITFLSKERMFVIILRLQSLFESNLIESAFFVCRKAKLCLQTLNNEHTLIKTTSIQQRNLITDLYFCCLAELNRKKLVSEINSMNSDELYKLIIRNSNLNKDGTKFAESRNQLLEISTKYFVAKVTLKPIDEFDDKTIEKFSNVWEILIQQHLDDNSNVIKIFFDKVFEKAQPKHIVVACDVMRKFNNPEWKSLLWEKVFSIITTKLNKLEKMKYSYPVNVESVIKYEKALVFYYKIFSNFLKDSSKHLYRECLLTLYSLCPCYELANLVDNEIFEILLIKSKNLKNFLTINNDNDMINDDISNVELITKDELLELATFFESELISEDYILETIDYADDLPTDTIDDVIMVLMSPRLKLLTWSLNAENLKCIMKKLLEPGQKRLYIERNLADANDKLTHVKVDARDYSHLPLSLEFPGIEKGYEEFESDSDEQQYDDDDYNNNNDNINNGLNEINNDSQDSDNNINIKRKRKCNKNLTSINSSNNNNDNNNNGIKRGRGHYIRRKPTIIRQEQLLRLNKDFVNQNQKENLNLSLNENNKNSDNFEIPILQNINDFDKKLNNSNKNNTNNPSALHIPGGRRVTRLNSVRLENINLMNLPNPSKISNRTKKLRDKQQKEMDPGQILHDEELKSIKSDNKNEIKISDDLLASSHQQPKTDEDLIINTLFSALNDGVATQLTNNLANSNGISNSIDSNDKNLQLLEKENVQPEPTTIEIFDRINEFIETELFGLPSISEEVVIQSDFKLNSNKNDSHDCDINLFNSSYVPKEICKDFNISLQTSILAETELTIQPVTKTYTRPKKPNQQQLDQKAEILNALPSKISSEMLAIPGTSKQEICYYPEESEEDMDLSANIVQKPINDDNVMRNFSTDNENRINKIIVEQNNSEKLHSSNNSSSESNLVLYNENIYKSNYAANYKGNENNSTINFPSSAEVVEIETFNKETMLSINDQSDLQSSDNCHNSSYISDDDSTCAQISDNGNEDYDNDHNNYSNGGNNSIFSLTDTSCHIENIDNDFKSTNIKNNLNNIIEYQFNKQIETHDIFLNNTINFINSDKINENTENLINDDNSERVNGDNMHETSCNDYKMKKHVTWNLNTGSEELNKCENENSTISNVSDANDNFICSNNIVHNNKNNENSNNNTSENQLLLVEKNDANKNISKNNDNNIILEKNMELEQKTILKRKSMSNLASSTVLENDDFNKRQKITIVENQLTKLDDDTTVHDKQNGGDINRDCDNDDKPSYESQSNEDEDQLNSENKKLKKLVITGIKTHQLSLVYDSSTSSSFDNTVQNLTSMLPNKSNKNTENSENNNMNSLSLQKGLKINLDRASFDILLKNKVNVMIDNYLVQHPIVRLNKLEDSVFLKKYKKNKSRQTIKQQHIESSEESNTQDQNLQLLDKLNNFKELKLTSVKSINLQLPGILPKQNDDNLNLLSNINWKKHFDNNIMKKINLNNENKNKAKSSLALSSKILNKSLFKKKKNRSDMKNVLKFLNEKMASKLNYINRQQNDDLYMSSSSNTSNTSNESLDYSTTYNNNSRVKKRIRSRRTTNTTNTNNIHRDIIFDSSDVNINFEDENYDNSIFNNNHRQIDEENDNNYNSSESSSSSVSGPIPTICKTTNNQQQQQRIKKFYNKRKNYNENFIDINNGYKKYYDTNATNKIKIKLSNKKQKHETAANKQLKETNDYILTKNASILSPMMVIKRHSANVQQKFIDNKKQINEIRKVQQNDPYYIGYQDSFQNEKKQQPRQVNYKKLQETETISLDYVPENQKRRRNTTNAPKYCELSPPPSPTTIKRQQIFLANKQNKYSKSYYISSASTANNKMKPQLVTKKIEEIDSVINLSDSEFDFENNSEDPLLPTASFVYVDNIAFETKNSNKYLRNDMKFIDNEYVNKSNDSNISTALSSNQFNNNENINNDLKLNAIKIDNLQKMLPPTQKNNECKNIQNQKRNYVNTTATTTNKTNHNHQNQNHNNLSGNKNSRIADDITLFISDESDHEKFSSDSEYKPSTKIKNIPPKRYNNETELRPSKYRNEFSIYSVLVNSNDINYNNNDNNNYINTNTQIVNIFKEFYSKNYLYNKYNIKYIDYSNDDINFIKSSKYNKENIKLDNIIKKLYYFGIMEYDNLISLNKKNKDNYKFTNIYDKNNNKNDSNTNECYNNVIFNINSKMKIYKTILNKNIKYLNNYKTNKFSSLLNSSNINDYATNEYIQISNYDIKTNNDIMNNLNYKTGNKNKFFDKEITNIRSLRKISHKVILYDDKFYTIINKKEYNFNNNNNYNNINNKNNYIMSIININSNYLIKNINNMNILNKIFYNINKILINNWLKNFKCRRKILNEFLMKEIIFKLVNIYYYENNYNENNIKIFLLLFLYHYHYYYNQILIKIINLIDIIYIQYNFLFL